MTEETKQTVQEMEMEKLASSIADGVVNRTRPTAVPAKVIEQTQDEKDIARLSNRFQELLNQQGTVMVRLQAEQDKIESAEKSLLELGREKWKLEGFLQHIKEELDVLSKRNLTKGK